jgi:hypothetical protein
MKKKLRSAFKTSKYPYIEQKHDDPQEITVLFNKIVKIKDVVLSFIFEVNNFFLLNVQHFQFGKHTAVQSFLCV